MKMKLEDFELLASLCKRVVEKNQIITETNREFFERLADHLVAKNKRIKQPAVAVRWTIFNSAILQPHDIESVMYQGTFGIRGKLYSYLNDSNIDTALRRIIKQLEDE